MAGTVVTAERLVETLGGIRALGQRPRDLRALQAQQRRGLPYATLESVMRRLRLTREEVSRLLLLPARTLARRKTEQRLRADESDRLLRLGRIAALAEAVLGDADKAARWLHAPNRALGEQAPLDHLDTDLGARAVEDVLVRISHGVHD